jgi:GntR family transcriptional regulator, colanic acid and biofilm gene transcriptional regulator
VQEKTAFIQIFRRFYKSDSTMTLSLDALSRDNLQERAYVSIREAIAAGQFPPGVAFTIRDLAAQLEISTTPVREALKRLIAEQALDLRQNRSMVVPVIGKSRIIEIRDLRMYLEGFVTERATAFIGQAELRRLTALHRKMQAEKRDPASYLKINREFHFGIYGHADLPVALKLIDQLWLQSGPTLIRLMSRIDLTDVFNGCHEHILEALGRNDAPAAAEAVRADIVRAAEALLAIEGEGADAPNGAIAVLANRRT